MKHFFNHLRMSEFINLRERNKNSFFKKKKKKFFLDFSIKVLFKKNLVFTQR
jgi:hypothetical protein